MEWKQSLVLHLSNRKLLSNHLKTVKSFVATEYESGVRILVLCDSDKIFSFLLSLVLLVRNTDLVFS
jgi:hypothetical protein